MTAVRDKDLSCEVCVFRVRGVNRGGARLLRDGDQRPRQFCKKKKNWTLHLWFLGGTGTECSGVPSTCTRCCIVSYYLPTVTVYPVFYFQFVVFCFLAFKTFFLTPTTTKSRLRGCYTHKNVNTDIFYKIV